MKVLPGRDVSNYGEDVEFRIDTSRSCLNLESSSGEIEKLLPVEVLTGAYAGEKLVWMSSSAFSQEELDAECLRNFL